MDGRGKVHAFGFFTMAKHDAFWSWGHVVDESDELTAVTMTGEPITGLHIHLNREADDVAGDIHRDFFCAALDTPPNGAFCLVPDEDESVLCFSTPVFEVLHHRASVHHPTGGKHDTGVFLSQDFFSHLSTVDSFEDF